jgi:simple sugar transport system ATP-binding protein
MELGTPLLEARSMSRSYGHVEALRDASISVHAGEVVALVGDNGAGKSTFVKILSGVVQPSGGTILVNGEPREFKSPIDARVAGVETVYQDLALASNLTVAENMFLGRERVRRPRGSGWLDRRAMNTETRRELDRLQITIRSVTANCGELSGGQRQAIAVARAVAFGSRVVLMDEPTAALGVQQQENVGRLIRQVRDSGMGVVLISHNLPQVQEICDRVVVLLHGSTVADLSPKDSPIEEIISWITGAAVASGQGRGH